MRQPLFVVMLSLFATAAAAQDQAPHQSAGRRGYFGAPVVKWTVIRDQGSIMIGGRGGWMATPSLSLGGGLYGTMTEIDAPGKAVADAPGPLDIRLESFGIELEYAPNAAAPTHMTLSAFVGGAAAHYVRDKTTEQHGETDFMLLLEPAVGVEQRVTAWMHVNLAASYRLANGVDQPGLENGDLNGAAAVLAVKLGRF